MRPIEPARIGYYPGVCKALGIPCNTPPPVPKTKCGESLECTGVSAQCFSGGGWSHREPHAGREQCVRCFQNRLPLYEKEFPEAHYMVKNWCPQDHDALFKYVECFCGLTGINANPFAPWPSTTTTTPMPSPAPPLPPPGPTPAPLPPGPACELRRSCILGLSMPRACLMPRRNGGHACYQGLKVWQHDLYMFGCPQFENKNLPIFESKAFCWCGLDGATSKTPQLGLAMNSTSEVAWPSQIHSRVGAQGSRLRLCRNSHDMHQLRRRGKPGVKADTRRCGRSTDGSVQKGANCMRWKLFLSYGCSYCYGLSIHCSTQHCLQECACSDTRECEDCMKYWCRSEFSSCAGFDPSFKVIRKGGDADAQMLELNISANADEQDDRMLFV